MRRRSTFALATALILSIGLAAPAAAQRGGGNFPERIELPDGFQPEGITAGPGTIVFAGSLADGSIRRIDVRTGAQTALVAGSGSPAVGLDYERGADRLWVAGGPTGEVRVYDASSGALLETYAFPAGGFLNDVVVTHDAVYVTDSFIQDLKVIPLGTGGALPDPADAFTLDLSGDITYVPGAFNVNGIVETAGWLVIVQSNTGQLFRVDPDTGVATEIDLGGATAGSGDGLELQGRTLYVVRNFLNQVAVFRLGARLESASLLGSITSPDLDIPATIAVQAGRLWTVNARFTTPPTPTTPYWMAQLPRRP